MPSISISDAAGMGGPAPMNSIPDVSGIGNPAPMTPNPDIASIGNQIPMISIPEAARIENPALISNNDSHNNNNNLDETSQAKRKPNRFEGLGLAQRLRLIQQTHPLRTTPHDNNVSVTSSSLPPLPPGTPTFYFPTTVSTEVTNTVNTTVPITISTTSPITLETIMGFVVEEFNLRPPNKQPIFPYTLYDFTKSDLVVSEISGINVEEQYHDVMAIVGEACGKCSKCTSDTRVQDLIDTIIEIQFPDLDTALFRDGILDEFGFDDYWNELIVAKPEVRRGYVKFETWYAKVWQDIEANNDLPTISKAIEKEFCRSRDFRRILAGKEVPECKWRKMELLIFVIRMRRIRGKLEEHPRTQEKQETKTIETTTKKNRKTRDKEKRRRLRDREDKIVAKLLHDTFEETNRLVITRDIRNLVMARREITDCFVKVGTPESIFSSWEKESALLPFINIQKFVSLVKVS
ncbi:uncharacterized protein EAF01_002582 [Botrytis porri]|uniref:Uncharacterized protein n=1 Tax=Botrytis porri TaxID=87229 RepID=A0A4Z1K8A6_9HELO|nr:uncharacterized protein EAF01_002582 [Botrytis porri]KAF7911074.1 hypothetical protein EAF01_002582 [Botrytis porri]TGO82333.1 hypothetical protein BPOR_0858g00010 [Botrytis porri]